MSSLNPSTSSSTRVVAPSAPDATALALPPSAPAEVVAPTAIPFAPAPTSIPLTPVTLEPARSRVLAAPTIPALSVDDVLAQVRLIQQVVSATMRDTVHYGRIPGCGDRPTLLKPGAEKLCLTFRLAPAYAVEEKQFERGHREYRVLCTLSSILSGTFIGQGVGVCSSLEAKYRYRGVQAEATDTPVPRAY